MPISGCTPPKKPSQTKDASKPSGPVAINCPAQQYPDDEAIIQCIRQLCRSDPAIVDRAANDLMLYSRKPMRVELQRYENGKWETKDTVTSLGTARGTTIWINRGEDCNKTKETVYHEVMHTMPHQQSMNSRDREIDAFTRTAQWQIDRRMTGRFQMTNPDGTKSVDSQAIISFVDRVYGYSSGELRIVNLKNGGNTVVLEDGTTRPAREADR